MKSLYDGCQIALSPGAAELATYEEVDDERLKANPKGHYWIAALRMSGCRLTCMQGYDEARRRRTSLNELRQRVVKFLNSISPSWGVVRVR